MKKILLLVGLLALSGGLAQAKPVNEYPHASGVNDTDLMYIYEVAAPHDFNLTPLQLKTYVLASVPGANITNGSITSAKLSFSLATVATSGSYLDLTNRPTIPAAQVNADWSATSGITQVLNRPVTGTTGITSGADAVTVTGLGLGFTPSYVIVTVRKASGGYNLFATVRGDSMTSDGFIVDLSGVTEAATYHLDYVIVK